MRRLFIGSTVMLELLENTRVPKDVDMFSDQDEPYADTYWHEKFAWWLPFGTNRSATLDELYTIKVSHAYWDLRNGSWVKHMSDVVALKRAGAKLIPYLHQLLYSVWTERHGPKRVNLNQDKQTFFTDAVQRTFDHDSIHESVAYGDRPLYESVRKDGESVLMDMAKVWTLPFDKQVQLFREEVYATALERWVIPSDYTCSPRMAYAQALKKTIVSLTKGRSARFMVENYDVFRAPDMDYVAHHLKNADRLVLLEGSR